MATVAVGAGLVLDQRVIRDRIRDRASYVFEGLTVIRVEPDWFVVQRDRDQVEAFVSVIVDLGGVVRCTCPAGLLRRGCDHVRAVGEQLDTLPSEPRRRSLSSKNVGARNGRAKLTEQQAGEIQWLLDHTDLRQQDIGARYGVSAQLVSEIDRGHKWSGVPPRQPPPAAPNLIRVTTAAWPAEQFHTANGAGPIPVGRPLAELVAAADD